MEDGAYWESPRQPQVTIESALADAVRHFRSEAAAYRSHVGDRARRMDKKVRQSLAATMDEQARIIENHAKHLKARTPA